MAKFFDLATLGGNLRGIGSSTFVPTTPFAAPGTGGSATTTSSRTPFTTSQFANQTVGGSGIPGSVRAGPGVRKGTTISEFGRSDFDAALIDWNRVYTDAQQGIPAALELIEQFAPGGDFGLGRRQEAREVIGEGVARDTAAGVASGLSSTSSARGLNVLAGRELSTAFANIEDQRAQLQIQAFSPYTQMLSNLASIGTSRPTAAQFIDRIATPAFGSAGTGGTTIRKVS